MINRRRFVQHGVAGSVTALVGGIPLLAGATTSEVSRESVALLGDGLLADGLLRDNRLKLHVALFDRRFAAGRHFAQTSETRGIATRAIAGDVTSVWYSELHPLWKQRPVAIAGLTTYGPLFCLERLAWDHGMRVLHRQEQDTRDAARAATPGEPNQILHAWIIAPRQRPPTWSVQTI
jgi:hypothetical protein